MSEFKEQVVVVTGASRGIGYAIAQSFFNNGATVIWNVTTENSKTNLIKQLEQDVDMSKVLIEVADVSDFEATKAMVDRIVAAHGRIDVLINNAGITKDGLLLRMSEADFDTVIDVNLKGAFNMVKHVIPVMVKQKYGRIINMSSVSGLAGNAGQINYAASKAGLVGMTKSLAKEYASRNITINAVAPGFIVSQMTDELSETVKAKAIETIPMKRLGSTDDVVFAVEMLAHQKASYITGEVLSVNGGLYM